MGRRAHGLAIVMVATTLSASCGSPPPPAPSAVITTDPTSVCIGDGGPVGGPGENTRITLDGSTSSANLSLVYEKPDPNEPPLRFLWSFTGSHVVIDSGDVTSPKLFVFMTADRPLHVHLRVENAAGGVAEALTTISVTPLNDDGTCPLPMVQ
jgi:hypothetical protein